MIDFNIKNGKLIVDEKILMTLAFSRIWEFDKSKAKIKANNTLLFIFNYCDITNNNPMKDVPNSDREALCKQNAFGKKDYKFTAEETILVNDAIEWYQIQNKDSVWRLSYGAALTVDEVAEYLEKPVVVDEEDEDGNKYTPGQIDKQRLERMKDKMDALKGLKPMLESKKQADEFVKQQFEKRKVKADATRSPLESRAIGYVKKPK